MNRPGPAMQAQVRDILILTASTGGGHDSVAVALQEALGELAPEVGVRVLDPLSGRIRNGPLSAGRWYDATVAHAPWLWGLFYHATNNAWAVRLGMAAGALLWARRLRSALQTARPGLVAPSTRCARASPPASCAPYRPLRRCTASSATW